MVPCLTDVVGSSVTTVKAFTLDPTTTAGHFLSAPYLPALSVLRDRKEKLEKACAGTYATPIERGILFNVQ